MKTDRYHHHGHGPCLALVCEHADRAQAVLAGTAIARAADAMSRARGVRARTERLHLVARVAALRALDLAAALAAEGVAAPSARALAPQVERALDRDALDALGADVWVSVTGAHGVPAAEHGVLRRLGTLAIEAADGLSSPRALARAIVRLEPLERSPEGPWPGILAAGPGLFDLTESGVRAFVAEVRDRLVVHCPGVCAWLPASGARETTVAVRTPTGYPGLPLTFAPFVVTDRETLAELETVGLPDAALPRPVYRLPVNEYRR